MNRLFLSLVLLLISISAYSDEALPNFSTRVGKMQHLSVWPARDNSERLELNLWQGSTKNSLVSQLNKIGFPLGSSDLVTIYIPVTNKKAFRYINNYVIHFDDNELTEQELSQIEIVFKGLNGNINHTISGQELGRNGIKLHIWINYGSVDSLAPNELVLESRKYIEFHLRLWTYKNENINGWSTLDEVFNFK